jgi:hypothetical protein
MLAGYGGYWLCQVLSVFGKVGRERERENEREKSSSSLPLHVQGKKKMHSAVQNSTVPCFFFSFFFWKKYK